MCSFRGLITLFTIIGSLLLVQIICTQSSLTAIGRYPLKTLSQSQIKANINSSIRLIPDYSNFLHDQNHVEFGVPRASSNCKDCHRISTPLEYIIKDYPRHESCLACHRQQFSTGPSSMICTICHTKPIKTGIGARFKFPKNYEKMKQEFFTYFPHGLHTELLAFNRSSPEGNLILKRVSFKALSQENSMKESCQACHEVQKERITEYAINEKWPDSFVPKDGTFITKPENHRNCFVCHGSSLLPWMSPQPVAENCTGCHSRRIGDTTKYTYNKSSSTVEPLGQRKDITVWRQGGVRRISIKFRHAGGGSDVYHQQVGCATCHVNIALKLTSDEPIDVSIDSCALCHSMRNALPDIVEEIDRSVDQPFYLCLGCHTSDVGKYYAPLSHYVIARRVPPLR